MSKITDEEIWAEIDCIPEKWTPEGEFISKEHIFQCIKSLLQRDREGREDEVQKLKDEHNEEIDEFNAGYEAYGKGVEILIINVSYSQDGTCSLINYELFKK